VYLLQIGTAQEAHLGRGLAGALSLLKSTGNLTTPTADSADRERTQKEKDLWLADRRRRLAQREIERIQARGGNKDQATREYENRMREQREASDALESFKSYKPDINIVYHDEFGRDLTPKEAWKALSHKFQYVPPPLPLLFHLLVLKVLGSMGELTLDRDVTPSFSSGKGSGKGKTDKRLAKIAQERKREAMTMGDTPSNMSRNFQERQERTGQAFMLLSQGNKS
jgi:U4/U6.U5 tri-snRNP-associated protein 1